MSVVNVYVFMVNVYNDKEICLILTTTNSEIEHRGTERRKSIERQDRECGAEIERLTDKTKRQTDGQTDGRTERY